MSAAVINVQDQKVTADLRIMLEDLVLYHELACDKDLRYSASDLKQAAQRHRKFLLAYFVVRDAEGHQLPGNVTQLDDSKIADKGVVQAELMQRELGYSLEFPLAAKPKYLTFVQSFGGKDAPVPAVMDCMIQQNGVLAEAPTELVIGQPHTASFDWENPPDRPPASWRDLLELKKKQLRQRLGIGSYSGLYSYIYITNREVRHEILVPLLTLETWLPIEREDPEFLEVREQQAARTTIREFLGQNNPVTINGRVIQPKLSRLNFFGLDINDFAQNAKPRRVSVYQARLGAILSYQTDHPHEVQLDWNTFNKTAPFLRSVVYVHNKPPKIHFFLRDRPNYHWKNSSDERGKALPEPVFAGATTKRPDQLTTQSANSITVKLIENVYRAFDYGDDSQVYDALAQSVEGRLLKQIYLQIKRSLVIREQGGAMSQVKSVKLISGKVVDADRSSFTCKSRWQVTGTVEHWGHIHTRQNEYEAEFSVAPRQGMWKVTGMQILGQQRIRMKTSVRGL